VTSEAELEALLSDLERAAAAAAAIGGDDPLGVRAIEDRPGERAYLCAFAGPRFLCLRRDLAPDREADGALEVVTAGLVVEHAETIIGEEALAHLAEAAGRAIVALAAYPDVAASVAEIAERAIALRAWRADPARAIASVPELDQAVRLHDALMVAWSRFVRASDPLAAATASLTPEVLEALRGLEDAAGPAHVEGSVANAIADAIPGCREGAREMLAAHVTALA